MERSRPDRCSDILNHNIVLRMQSWSDMLVLRGCSAVKMNRSTISTNGRVMVGRKVEKGITIQDVGSASLLIR